MQMHSNTDGRDFDELIGSCMEPVRKLAGKYARDSWRFEFEELYSIGMLEVCKEAPHAYEAATNPLAYLCKAAQNAMLEEINGIRERNTISLDAPLSSESSFSLADLLPDRSSLPVSTSSQKRVRVVRKAVNRLTPLRRAAVLHFYGFQGYGEHTSTEAGYVLGSNGSTVRSATYKARKLLQRDEQFCKAVGVEVQA